MRSSAQGSARLALALLLISVVGSLIAGLWAYRSSREELLEAVARTGLSLCRALGSLAEVEIPRESSSDILQRIESQWREDFPPYDGSTLSIVSPSGIIAIDTRGDLWQGKVLAGFPFEKEVGSRMVLSDDEGDQIVSHLFVKKLQAYIVVMIPVASVSAQYQKQALPWSLLLVFALGVLMPTGLLVSWRSSNLRRVGDLQNLNARIQSARDDQTLALARELHDELGQILAMVKLELSRDKYDRDRIRELNASALTCLHNLVSGLRPSLLDQVGLGAAIAWCSREMEKSSEIPISVKIPEKEPELTKERALALFRIFQELLTNAATHSGGDHIHVTLAIQRELVLTIQDDGTGMPTGLPPAGSHGLLGIHERLESFGGRLEIESQKGTTMTVRVPL